MTDASSSGTNSMRRVRIVFVGAESAGNVGSICRIMANFGLSELFLVNPHFSVDLRGDEARSRAMSGKHILQTATFVSQLDAAIENRWPVFGASAKLGNQRKLSTEPVDPISFTHHLMKALSGGASPAIVLGRESTGLTADEMALCDGIVRIPANPAYPVFNVAVATAILLYQLFVVLGDDNAQITAPNSAPTSSGVQLHSSRHGRSLLKERADKVLDMMPNISPTKKKKYHMLLERLIDTSLLSSSEAYAFQGFFGSILRQIHCLDDEKGAEMGDID